MFGYYANPGASVVSSLVQDPPRLEYKLTEQAVGLWNSTEGVDGYYRKWFCKLAVQEFSGPYRDPGVDIYVLDHDNKTMAKLKTVKVDKAGP